MEVPWFNDPGRKPLGGFPPTPGECLEIWLSVGAEGGGLLPPLVTTGQGGDAELPGAFSQAPPGAWVVLWGWCDPRKHRWASVEVRRARQGAGGVVTHNKQDGANRPPRRVGGMLRQVPQAVFGGGLPCGL